MARAPRLRAAVAVAIASAVLGLAATLRPFGNADVLWQIRMGDAILAARAPLTTDPFSAAFRGAPLHDHEAAFEAAVALFYRAGAFPMLALVTFVGVAVGLGAAIKEAGRLAPRVSSRVIAAGLLVAVVGARVGLRAELAIWAAIAVAHALRRRRREATPATATFAPIVVAAVAAPFHVLAVLVALVPLAHALEAVATARKPTRGAAIDLGVAFASIGAVCLVAPGTPRYLYAEWSTPFSGHIIERYGLAHAFAVSGDSRPMLSIGAAIVATIGLALARRRAPERVRLADLFLLAALIVPGLRYLRFASFAPLAALPLVIAGLAALVEPITLRLRPLLAGALALTAVAAAVAANLGSLDDVPPFTFPWSRQPLRAVAWLERERPDATLFHPYNEGAYLIFVGYPRRGVFIDPRAAMVYPPAYAARYFEALDDGEAFDRLANEAKIDTVLLRRDRKSSTKLIEHLAASRDWIAAYADDQARVFVRK